MKTTVEKFKTVGSLETLFMAGGLVRADDNFGSIQDFKKGDIIACYTDYPASQFGCYNIIQLTCDNIDINHLNKCITINSSDSIINNIIPKENLINARWVLLKPIGS